MLEEYGQKRVVKKTEFEKKLDKFYLKHELKIIQIMFMFLLIIVITIFIYLFEQKTIPAICMSMLFYPCSFIFSILYNQRKFGRKKYLIMKIYRERE